MPRILITALLALCACSTEAPLLPAPGYRDRDIPMGSIAMFDPARFAGRWYEVASYPVPFQAGCRNTQALYAVQPDGTLSVENSCQGQDGALRRIEGEARPIGPGRLEVTFDTVPFLSSPYWVLWVDESYRTAVVGVPSGRAGWILNRDPSIPPDRLEAAKTILAFNGYDLSRLRETPQRALP
ncbi:lipocalin family protein [Palleronia sp. LCG004]|uniref:lipocalin family protein n=1 Tax=Palleronia sp. LCG004 TaxID=3079304 RepID=UPI0029435837|nr:lipocalin family protein [Palleronia sp. LCG004]WOI55055.1 lipocalin family protein [Palleronia sp. LCG004]